MSNTFQKPVYLSNQPETTNPTPCKVVGQFPDYLKGQLYRAGPGYYDGPADSTGVPAFRVQHWFDGFALIHRLQIEGGKVEYSSRFTSSGTIAEVTKNGFQNVTFAQDPCQSIFWTVASAFTNATYNLVWPKVEEPRDPASSNVSVNLLPGLGSGSDIVALTDANVLQDLDPTSLLPKKLYSYTKINPQFAGHLSAAHPSVDPKTQEVFNFSLEFGKKCSYNLFSISPKEPLGHLVGKIDDMPTYIHSIGLTENYLMLIVHPFVIGYNGLEIMTKKNILQSLHWDPSKPTTFYVLSRKDNKLVSKYQTPAFFFFHTVNAFETHSDGRIDITIDICTYESPEIVQMLYLEKLSDPTTKFPRSFYSRYVLENVNEESLTPRTAIVSEPIKGTYYSPELARFNEHKSLQKHRYVYSLNVAVKEGKFIEGLIKADLETGELIRWEEPHCVPGEGVFVPRPNAELEDDGVVLSVVCNESSKESFLLCLDAKTFKEIGRAILPQIVPLGFHGIFTPSPETNCRL